jgi:hypothetical protein
MYTIKPPLTDFLEVIHRTSVDCTCSSNNHQRNVISTINLRILNNNKIMREVFKIQTKIISTRDCLVFSISKINRLMSIRCVTGSTGMDLKQSLP